MNRGDFESLLYIKNNVLIKDNKIMNRDILKNLIELVPDKDIDTLYKVIIKSIPKDIIASNSETLDGLLDGSDEKINALRLHYHAKLDQVFMRS